MTEYPENPGPLPTLDLKNKSDGGKGPIGKKDFCLKDPQQVQHLQKILITLGYDLGTYGPDRDGVDGIFGNTTETAAMDFQEKHQDWEDNRLTADGLVGPRTSDALNRAMVGIWYDHYQTPEELVENKQYHTVTSAFLSKGLLIKPGTSHRARILLADKKELQPVPHNLKLLLGIEVAPLGRVKTWGQFDLGIPGSGHDPLGGFSSISSFEGEQEGDIHSTILELGDLNGKTIRIRAGKSNVLETYNKKTGETTFRDTIHPTEEMVAAVHIFRGEKCLTGNATFEDVKNLMNPTKSGINQILIRLDDHGSSIQDCIIDGVEFVAQGQQKIRMGR